MYRFAISLWCLFIPLISFSQIKVDWNAYVDLELSRGGRLSDFYYNEINRIDTGWLVDIPQVNLLASVQFSDQWRFNAHVLFNRHYGLRPGIGQELDYYDFIPAQLNVQWKSKAKRISVTAGRFINPFGSFFQNQLYADRSVINMPLAYSYYTNIDPAAGFVENLGEDPLLNIDTSYLESGGFRVGDTKVLGMPLLYGLGYKTGVRFNWGHKERTFWTIALVNGASSLRTEVSNPVQLGIISRLSYRPTYYLKLGFSGSFGTYLQQSEYLNSISDFRTYNQSLIGLDYKLEWGFWQLSGEVIGAFFSAPEILTDGESDQFIDRSLASFSTYSDLKYQPPFIPGSFITYRIDIITFSNYNPVNGSRRQWENNAYRHALTVGYRLTSYLDVRAMLSTQQTDNKMWDEHQRAFRMMLNFHW